MPDEKPSIQSASAAIPRCPQHRAAGGWDVSRAKIFDPCVANDGIVLSNALVHRFISVEAHRFARPGFVID